MTEQPSCPICGTEFGSWGSVKAHITRKTDEDHKGKSGPEVIEQTNANGDDSGSGDGDGGLNMPGSTENGGEDGEETITCPGTNCSATHDTSEFEDGGRYACDECGARFTWVDT